MAVKRTEWPAGPQVPEPEGAVARARNCLHGDSGVIATEVTQSLVTGESAWRLTGPKVPELHGARRAILKGLRPSKVYGERRDLVAMTGEVHRSGRPVAGPKVSAWRRGGRQHQSAVGGDVDRVQWRFCPVTYGSTRRFQVP